MTVTPETIQQTTDILSSRLIMDFIRLFLAIISIILLFRIVWRVEKGLDYFFKLITAGWLLVFFRHLLLIFEELGFIVVGRWVRPLEVIPTLLFIWALIVMNRLIVRLNREK